jgi:hypothetical protein
MPINLGHTLMIRSILIPIAALLRILEGILRLGLRRSDHALVLEHSIDPRIGPT